MRCGCSGCGHRSGYGPLWAVVPVVVLMAARLAAQPPEEKPIALRVDGRTVRAETPPRLIGGHMHVPARDLLIGMGAEVEWNDAAKTITARLPRAVVVFELQKTTARRNDAPVDVGLPVVVADGKAFLPVQLCDPALLCQTQWQEDERRVEVRCLWEKQRVSVEELLRWSLYLMGKPIIVEGEYRGWVPGAIGPAVAKGRPKRMADWVLRDATGDVYVSGRSPKGLDPLDDVGRRVVVEGAEARTEEGIAFVEARTVQVLPG